MPATPRRIVDHREVNLFQPLSAWAAAAVLRSLYPQAAGGDALRRLKSVPHSKGHFCRSYTMFDLMHWVRREQRRAVLHPTSRWLVAPDGMTAVDETQPTRES